VANENENDSDSDRLMEGGSSVLNIATMNGQFLGMGDPVLGNPSSSAAAATAAAASASQWGTGMTASFLGFDSNGSTLNSISNNCVGAMNGTHVANVGLGGFLGSLESTSAGVTPTAASGAASGRGGVGSLQSVLEQMTLSPHTGAATTTMLSNGGNGTSAPPPGMLGSTTSTTGGGGPHSPHFTAHPHHHPPPLQVISSALMEAGLLEPAFYHALLRVDFVPDGYYQQDYLSLEEQIRRAEFFNAAVDQYITAGIDHRPMLEIECLAKIGVDGGPLYQRCTTCRQPVAGNGAMVGLGSAAPSPALWCSRCNSTPFCSAQCHQGVFSQHQAVCGGLHTKPVLPSQTALKMALEVHAVHGLEGGALQQAILRRMQLVQESYQHAATAANAALGIVS
jgi:hypothetical protein